MKYVCPMHPEVTSDKPGTCPKCGMRLVESSKNNQGGLNRKLSDYKPLIIIIGLIFLVSLVSSMQNFATAVENLELNFMAGFFLVFGGFKILDIKGFADGYSTYDLLAKKWFGYGYIYPFLEFFFGVSYLTRSNLTIVAWMTLIVMTFSGMGVAIKLARREKFQCVCLGTIFKIPLSEVTLIEDFGMAVMALLLLFQY